MYSNLPFVRIPKSQNDGHNFHTIAESGIDTVKVSRGGIIPMCTVGERVLLGFAIDMHTGSLVNFAGHITFGKETMLEGCLREFNEETYNVLEAVVTPDYLKANSAFMLNEMLLSADKKKMMTHVRGPGDANRVKLWATLFTKIPSDITPTAITERMAAAFDTRRKKYGYPVREGVTVKEGDYETAGIGWIDIDELIVSLKNGSKPKIVGYKMFLEEVTPTYDLWGPIRETLKVRIPHLESMSGLLKGKSHNLDPPKQIHFRNFRSPKPRQTARSEKDFGVLRRERVAVLM